MAGAPTSFGAAARPRAPAARAAATAVSPMAEPARWVRGATGLPRAAAAEAAAITGVAAAPDVIYNTPMAPPIRPWGQAVAARPMPPPAQPASATKPPRRPVRSPLRR